MGCGKAGKQGERFARIGGSAPSLDRHDESGPGKESARALHEQLIAEKYNVRLVDPNNPSRCHCHTKHWSKIDEKEIENRLNWDTAQGSTQFYGERQEMQVREAVLAHVAAELKAKADTDDKVYDTVRFNEPVGYGFVRVGGKQSRDIEWAFDITSVSYSFEYDRQDRCWYEITLYADAKKSGKVRLTI